MRSGAMGRAEVLLERNMFVIANAARSLLATPLVAWTLGWQEILVIVVVVLILFGGRKIPELAKGIGKGLREFKKEMRGVRQDFEDAANETEEENYTPPRRRKKRRRKPVESPEAPADEDADEADDEAPVEEPAEEKA